MSPDLPLLDSLSQVLGEHLQSDQWQSQLLENQQKIIQLVEDQIFQSNSQNKQLDALVMRLENLENNLACLSESLTASADEEEAESFDWHTQKEKFLEGIEGSSRREPARKTRESTAAPEPQSSEPDDQAKSTSADVEEPTDVAEMRAKLEEKLREAEIEISVERAKIARIQRELDAQKTEMEREFAKREEKLQAAGKCMQKGRWSRFLGRSNS